MDAVPPMKMYTDLTDYWTFITAPEEYVEEAAFYRQTLDSALPAPPARCWSWDRAAATMSRISRRTTG
jgi:hypothetical protein